MKRMIKLLFGMGWVASCDMATGILVFHIASRLFDYPADIYGYAMAMFCAMLPDLDIFITKIIHKKVTSSHRDLLHKPVVSVILFSAIAPFSLFWAVASSMSFLGHLIHDSIGNVEYSNWGVKWFWPFSRNQYQIFARKHKDSPRKILTVWTFEELKKEKFLVGIERWLDLVYFRFSATARIEMIYIITVGIALFYYK